MKQVYYHHFNWNNISEFHKANLVEDFDFGTEPDDGVSVMILHWKDNAYWFYHFTLADELYGILWNTANLQEPIIIIKKGDIQTDDSFLPLYKKFEEWYEKFIDYTYS